MIQSMNEKNWNIARLALLGAWLAILCVIFYPVAMGAVHLWQNKTSDMMHGWIVTPVALAMAWPLRKKITASAGRPAWGGLLLLPLIFALLWFGHRGGQPRFSQLGMLLAIPCVLWAGWGRNVAKTLLFPTAFMLFIIDLSIFDIVTLPLRLLSSWISMFMLNGFNIGVIREGSALVSTTGRFNLDVAEPCSGLRSIFAILTISAAYGFFHQKTLLRALSVIAFGVPVAVIANIVRLITIGVVAHLFGQDKAMQIYHDASGFITFPVAILLMMVFGDKVAPRIGKVPPPAPIAPPAKQAPWPAGICFLLLAAAFSAGMMATINRLPPTILEPDAFIARQLPEKLGHIQGSPVWYCQQMNCQRMFAESEVENWDRDTKKPLCAFCGHALDPLSAGEANLLPADTRILKRIYKNAQDSYLVTVVVSGMNRASIHRPQQCLPAQGYEIASQTVHHLTLDNGARLDIVLIKARKAGAPDIGFVNFLVSNRLQTASHFHRLLHDAWQRSVYGRINRWAMFSIVGNESIETPEQLERIRVLLSDWLPQVWLDMEQE